MVLGVVVLDAAVPRIARVIAGDCAGQEMGAAAAGRTKMLAVLDYGWSYMLLAGEQLKCAP